MKSLLSVRSDVLPDRTGNIRNQFWSAGKKQLPRAPTDLPGIVAIRIRPPRDPGDLFDADQMIRDLMARVDPEHVALAVLFWDESERQEAAVEDDGQPATEKLIAYHLRPYFIPNPQSRLKVGLDSFQEHFGTVPEALMRDPIDGSLKPVAPETMAELRSGGPMPAHLKGAVAELGSLDPDEGATTQLVRFHQPVGTLSFDELIGVIPTPGRQFRSFLDTGQHLRTIEVCGGAPRRVCTIDLRAWGEATELGLVIQWTSNSFRAGLWSPDESELLMAQATEVPQLEGD